MTRETMRIQESITGNKDLRWTLFYIAGMLLLWVWNIVFLNRPAYLRIQSALYNTVFIGILVIFISAGLGWVTGLLLHFLEKLRVKVFYLSAAFLFNLLRSIPQIVGILIGYILLTLLIKEDELGTEFMQMIWIAVTISLFVFQEVSDVIRERITHFQRTDFYHAMLCSGIKESRIINVEILWRNSAAHLLHKLISLFGVTVFLLCSIDFIISVGLSTNVSLSNLPVTLGGLLARLDSKQDIMAIGTALTDPGYFGSLFFEHLQGISIAFIIFFTLLSVYQVTNGLVERHRL